MPKTKFVKTFDDLLPKLCSICDGKLHKTTPTNEQQLRYQSECWKTDRWKKTKMNYVQVTAVVSHPKIAHQLQRRGSPPRQQVIKFAGLHFYLRSSSSSSPVWSVTVIECISRIRQQQQTRRNTQSQTATSKVLLVWINPLVGRTRKTDSVLN